MLAADIGVSAAVARLIFKQNTPMPVPIDQQVIRDQQKTLDRYVTARVVRSRLDAWPMFDTSFNVALE